MAREDVWGRGVGTLTLCLRSPNPSLTSRREEPSAARRLSQIRKATRLLLPTLPAQGPYGSRCRSGIERHAHAWKGWDSGTGWHRELIWEAKVRVRIRRFESRSDPAGSTWVSVGRACGLTNLASLAFPASQCFSTTDPDHFGRPLLVASTLAIVPRTGYLTAGCARSMRCCCSPGAGLTAPRRRTSREAAPLMIQRHPTAASTRFLSPSRTSTQCVSTDPSNQ